MPGIYQINHTERGRVITGRITSQLNQNKNMINISLDYDKLKEALLADPSIIKTTDKGKKFLNLTVNESKEVKYGNTHYVAISTTKEERAAGKKGAIIGNGKEFIFNNQQIGQQQTTNYIAPPPSPETIDDLPF